MGAPVGNTNAAQAKRWQQAILRALARKTELSVDAGLDKAAEQLVQMAFDGDKWAIDHLADRVEGKAAQTVIGDPDSPLKHVIEWKNGPSS